MMVGILGKIGIIVGWLLMMIGLLGLCVESRNPVLHRVGGGRSTWAPNMNFTDWSSHEHFYVGDWLYFGFDKTKYSVFQVNQTSYEKCVDRDFIKNITRGGRDVFNLTEAKPYYFISGGGYCSQGMKVEVNAVDAPPSPPAQPPQGPTANGGSPGACFNGSILYAVLAVAIIYV